MDSQGRIHYYATSHQPWVVCLVDTAFPRALLRRIFAFIARHMSWQSGERLTGSRLSTVEYGMPRLEDGWGPDGLP